MKPKLVKVIGIDLKKFKKAIKNSTKSQKKAMAKCKILADVAKLFPYNKDK